MTTTFQKFLIGADDSAPVEGRPEEFYKGIFHLLHISG